ncbi:MAG TPA: CbtA family protein [Acidimicrobiia bacterium]|nr:CbtA family protein [Acidimicrobiia bacterium]
MSMRDLMVRGLLAGLIAGVLGFCWLKTFGEPQVNRAIKVEEQIARAHHEPEEPELVSRDVQSTAGLATGVFAIAIAFGGLFALAFAAAYGRMGSAGPRTTSLVVALLGFTAIYLVPFFKYPANPPSVGQPDTIGRRTALYFVLMLISLAVTTGAVVLRRRLLARHGAWNATLLAAGAFIVVVGLTWQLLPGINEVPEEFPAVTLWRFRVASLGAQLLVWTTIGLVFGALSERATVRSARLTALRESLSVPAYGPQS